MIHIALVLAFASIASLRGAPESAQSPMVLTHASVIEGTGAPVQPDMTFLIEGRRIVSLGKHGAPQNYRCF